MKTTTNVISKLYLLNSRDLSVDSSDRRASVRRLANSSRIALERAEDQRVNHALDVSIGLCISEGLIGDGLLQAVGVLPSTSVSLQKYEGWSLLDVR